MFHLIAYSIEISKQQSIKNEVLLSIYTIVNIYIINIIRYKGIYDSL